MAKQLVKAYEEIKSVEEVTHRLYHLTYQARNIQRVYRAEVNQQIKKEYDACLEIVLQENMQHKKILHCSKRIYNPT